VFSLVEFLRATLARFNESVRGRTRQRILNCVSDRDHMELAERSVCGAILFCGLVFPVVGSSPQDESIARVTLQGISGADISRGPTQNSGPQRCFDARSAESNTRKERRALADLPVNYRFWLTEDAAYIITPEERCAFLQLRSDEERDIFIEQFWHRRSPDPESFENPFQEEHYRRIVFVTNKFGTDIPGWQTDRGHIYIQYGPPDVLVSHPAGESTWRPPKDAPDSVKYSWENWHYKYVEGLGENVDFEFVNAAGSGEYQLRIRSKDKNTSIFEPYHSASRDDPAAASSKKVPLDSYIDVEPVPRIRYKDLEAMAVSKIIRNQVCFGHRIRFVRATHASTMATIVVDLQEDQASTAVKDRKSTDGYEIFGRITRPSGPTGRVVSTFERRINGDEPGREDLTRESTVPLKPGLYYLALVVKAVDSGNTGVSYTTFEVPGFDEMGMEE
jgi:GWxTD domain-containing protein